MQKVVAGLVCGVAAAVPGQYMLSATLTGLTALVRTGEGLQLAVAAAPFGVFGLVLLVSAVAPTVRGAWFRGCLLACVASGVLAIQALQCVGIAWFAESAFDDPYVRQSIMVGCAEDLTPAMALLSAACAIAFGVAAVVIWRKGREAAETDY